MQVLVKEELVEQHSRHSVSSANALADLHSEIAVMRALRHRNIVALLEVRRQPEQHRLAAAAAAAGLGLFTCMAGDALEMHTAGTHSQECTGQLFMNRMSLSTGSVHSHTCPHVGGGGRSAGSARDVLHGGRPCTAT